MTFSYHIQARVETELMGDTLSGVNYAELFFGERLELRSQIR